MKDSKMRVSVCRSASQCVAVRRGDFYWGATGGYSIAHHPIIEQNRGIYHPGVRVTVFEKPNEFVNGQMTTLISSLVVGKAMQIMFNRLSRVFR